ncbi:S1 RNA-binding domain-containing protein [Streptomyces microflavus]|uniref:S1 RNA-binding domain-containing protein n=1 Tax=Streptomyces microflavus TaxID=1919 RepID=UPI0037FBE3BE
MARRVWSSLRAAQPDPFQTFAGRTAVGQELHGRVTERVPFGVFVQVTDGIEALVHLRELASTLVESPSDVARTGDEVTVEAPRQARCGSVRGMAGDRAETVLPRFVRGSPTPLTGRSGRLGRVSTSGKSVYGHAQAAVPETVRA